MSVVVRRSSFVVPVSVLLAVVVGWAVATRSMNQVVALVLGLLLFLSAGIAAAEGWTALAFAGAGVMLVSALTDWPRLVAVGPVTLLGALTIVYAVVGILLSIGHRSSRSAALTLRPFLWFVAWTAISFMWYSPTIESLQNVAVFVTFAALARATAGVFAVAPRSSHDAFKWFDRAIYLSVFLYLVTVVVDGPGTDLFLSARGFALFGMLGVARGLAVFRYESRRGAFMIAVVIVAVMLSLSRTALAICLLLVPLAWLDRRSIPRRMVVVLAIGLAVGLFVFAATSFGPLAERFAEPDKSKVGGVTLSVSGRDKFWSATWQSWLQSPWIGHGAGSAEFLPARYLPEGWGSSYSHPHNDYLRLLHDYGVVGAGLWVVAFVFLVRRTRQKWWAAARSGAESRTVHLQAVLSMTALALAMITDNVIVYAYLIAPLAILVGASLAREPEELVPFDRRITGPDRTGTSPEANASIALGSGRPRK
ncbi:MAG: O-antigen ligase family protein [Actinomycetota bacterium]|nr:O-antigen ligase family protein [Actinomycetota bacterium]